jgi:hypothetical protein
LTLALKSPSPLSEQLPELFLAGFVRDHPSISMISCQTRKYPPLSYKNNLKDGDEKNVEVWNVLSTATFAKKHKAPQEFLPEEVVANVTQLLVEALQDVTGSVKAYSLPLLEYVVDSRVQLWGAAVPMNVWKGDGPGGFIYDSQLQVGVCGDWLLEPSIAGAWTSGRQLARHLKETSQHPQSSENKACSSDDGNRHRSVGLAGHFEASPGVRKLGIASLDGPVNKRSSEKKQSLLQDTYRQQKQQVQRKIQSQESPSKTEEKRKPIAKI